jgi:hypothetical protein
MEQTKVVTKLIEALLRSIDSQRDVAWLDLNRM